MPCNQSRLIEGVIICLEWCGNSTDGYQAVHWYPVVTFLILKLSLKWDRPYKARDNQTEGSCFPHQRNGKILNPCSPLKGWRVVIQAILEDGAINPSQWNWAQGYWTSNNKSTLIYGPILTALETCILVAQHFFCDALLFAASCHWKQWVAATIQLWPLKMPWCW